MAAATSSVGAVQQSLKVEEAPNRFAKVPPKVNGRILSFLFGDHCSFFRAKTVSKSFQAVAIEVQNPYLIWQLRPKEMREEIDRLFSSVAKGTSSNWLSYNGAEGYGICSVDEYRLVLKLVREAPPTQKVVTVLDIGAGNFQWADAIARAVSLAGETRKDLTLRIIALRGEKLPPDAKPYARSKWWQEEEGLRPDPHMNSKGYRAYGCTAIVYELGNFKIEELSQAFKARGFHLENEVDFATSRSTFCHFADPLGTMAQVVDLLRPGKGLLATDGFPLLRKDQLFKRLHSTEPVANQIQFLLDAGLPFVMHYYPTKPLEFLVRRPSAAPCLIPMSYCSEPDPNITEVANVNCLERRHISCYTRNAPAEPFKMTALDDPNILYGDRRLYDWIAEAGLYQHTANITATPNGFQALP